MHLQLGSGVISKLLLKAFGTSSKKNSKTFTLTLSTVLL